MGYRRAFVAIALLLATSPTAAGCGNDEENGETTRELAGAAQAEALQDEIADLSDEEQITRVGAAWAEPFAAGEEEMCAYMHPDVVPAAESCTPFREGALTGSTTLQRSYAGATVTEVTLDGDTATAEFSNGEPVEFQTDADGHWWIVGAKRKGNEAP